MPEISVANLAYENERHLLQLSAGQGTTGRYSHLLPFRRENKAQGKNIDSLFQGKWVFYKKVGFLWNVGHFKDHQKHGQWIRYHDNGSIEKDETFEMGNKVKKKS